jgi:hypothetical protein
VSAERSSFGVEPETGAAARRMQGRIILALNHDFLDQAWSYRNAYLEAAEHLLAHARTPHRRLLAGLDAAFGPTASSPNSCSPSARNPA